LRGGSQDPLRVWVQQPACGIEMGVVSCAGEYIQDRSFGSFRVQHATGCKHGKAVGGSQISERIHGDSLASLKRSLEFNEHIAPSKSIQKLVDARLRENWFAGFKRAADRAFLVAGEGHKPLREFSKF
jgi:hypothetical protein